MPWQDGELLLEPLRCQKPQDVAGESLTPGCDMVMTPLAVAELGDQDQFDFT